MRRLSRRRHEVKDDRDETNPAHCLLTRQGFMPPRYLKTQSALYRLCPMADAVQTCAATAEAAAVAGATLTASQDAAATAATTASVVDHTPAVVDGALPSAANAVPDPSSAAAAAVGLPQGVTVAEALKAAEAVVEAEQAAVAHLSSEANAECESPVGLGGLSGRKRGRPPNINENSLIRRLECVLLVESGRVPLKEACQLYQISPRTFYRWLSSKDRLIQLTGHSQESAVKLQQAVHARLNADPTTLPTTDMVTADDGTPSRKRAAAISIPVEGSAGAGDFSDKRRMPAVAPGSAGAAQATAGEKRRLPVSRSARQAVDVAVMSRKMSPAPGGSVAMGFPNGAAVASPVGMTSPALGTPKKTRVQLTYGDVTAALGWHQGASADDIRQAIQRRFGIADRVDWAIVDCDNDELVVSAAIPAGSYSLKLLSQIPSRSGTDLAFNPNPAGSKSEAVPNEPIGAPVL